MLQGTMSLFDFPLSLAIFRRLRSMQSA